MRYNIDVNGYLNGLGSDAWFNYNANGTEPFLNANEGEQWRLIDGEWVNEKAGYKYFLIPSDLVPQIGHYAGFVKEALFHLAFNVKANEIDAIVEGQSVTSPLFINFIPCNCTHWTDEGLQLLDAVVENWNTSNTHKPMVEPYKFESYNELMAFRNANI